MNRSTYPGLFVLGVSMYISLSTPTQSIYNYNSVIPVGTV